jgi:ankyrin repeat protein
MGINLTELLDHAEECFQIQCHNDSEEVNLLSKSYCGDTLLHVAVIRENSDEVNYLINEGLDINSRGDFLETPLFLAASLEKIKMIKLLLKLGADSSIPNNLGALPKEALLKVRKGREGEQFF